VAGGALTAGTDGRTDGAVPDIADYAFLSDCHSAALVSSRGSVDWWCLPHTPGLARLGKRLAGVAVERDAPRFAPETFQDWWLERMRRQNRPQPRPGDPNVVVLWPDTFTNAFDPRIGRAAVEVLEDAGFTVTVPMEPVCCALTWISTGQLGVARRMLQATVATLRPWIEAGTLVVGLEPSCPAVFRADAPELLPEDEDVARLRARFVTLAEALLQHAPRPWEPTPLGRAAIVQAHCHQHAVMKFDADLEVMDRAGIDARRLDSGCCGLAGNFGFEAGHYEVSMACAEQALLPAVRTADPDTLVLADGFSCPTQIEQAGTGRRALHLAEALAGEAVAGKGREDMRSRLLHEVDGLRTFVVVMDKGDEATEELLRFAREHEVSGGGLTAVGACREATLAYFDRETLTYQDIPVAEQVEVLSLLGDIATTDGEPALHAHAVLGYRGGSTVGGHLQRAIVWPTLEVIVTESPAHLRKRVDAGTGLALIALDG
jgi:predicted DNA-binding protein with PD1-like motif/Fe-S oxidoreductase